MGLLAQIACGSPYCGAPARVHVEQIFTQITCQALGHRWETIPIRHVRLNGSTIVLGSRLRCRRCHIDRRSDK